MQRENRLKGLLVVLLFVFLVAFVVVLIFSLDKKQEPVPHVPKKETPSDSVEPNQQEFVPALFFGGTVSKVEGDVISVIGTVTVSKSSVPNETSNESRVTTTEQKTVTCSISKETKFTNAQKEEIQNASLEKGTPIYIEYEEKDNMPCKVTLVETLPLKGRE